MTYGSVTGSTLSWGELTCRQVAVVEVVPVLVVGYSQIVRNRSCDDLRDSEAFVSYRISSHSIALQEHQRVTLHTRSMFQPRASTQDLMNIRVGRHLKMRGSRSSAGSS
jgi:hypothetical protein